jgi:hypothetical protein
MKSFRNVMLLALGLVLSPLAEPQRFLDQSRVHDFYNDGNFDGVVDLIGRFKNQNPEYTRDDSIFIAKHLSVVYAANPSTVGQGKYWMNELLKLMPAADLVGMYVSGEIDRIFENVRKEFLSRQQAFGVDTSLVSLPARPNPGSPGKTEPPASGLGSAAVRPKESIATAGAVGLDTARTRSAVKRAYWMLGGASLAAAGVVAFLVLAPSPEPQSDKVVTIPRKPGGQ